MPVLGRQQQRKVYRLKCLAAMLLVAFAMLGVIFEMSFDISDDVGGKAIMTTTTPTPTPTKTSAKPPHHEPEKEGTTSSFGPEAMGVLGKLGVNSKLPERLQKGSHLCSQCVPKDVSLTPSFCTQTEADFRKTNDIHFESNQIPKTTLPTPTKYTMVYVAIGSSLHGVNGSTGGRQDYVLEAIKQWRLFNPPAESHVILVVSDEFATESSIVSFAETHSVEIVSEKTIPLTTFYERYLQVFYIQGYMHPGGSRKTGNKDFNRLVMQRFHVLHSLIKQRNLEHVVHTENDIMIYARWAEIVPAIVKCNMQLASTFASPKGVIPSVVYIRDYEAIEHMISFVNDLLACGEQCLSKTKENCPAGCVWTSEGSEARSGGCLPSFGISLNKALKIGVYANDMTYLLNYWQYYGSSRLSALPAWEHTPGENCIYDQRPNEIFDLASFGQWYSFSPPGMKNPKPAKQYVQAMKKGRFLDPSPPPYLEWKTDEKNRRVPWWKQYKILSLHIHGKNLERFRSIDPQDP